MKFLEVLKNSRAGRSIPVIPDIKCISPKEGDLMRGRNPVDIAKQLAQAGAPAISVVTERQEFGGSLELLRDICGAVNVPVLRKDFVQTERDIIETKAAGAAAVLLMYSCLPSGKLAELYHIARKAGLDVLVETHTEDEMRLAAKLGARLVGINNRDITVLERDDGNVGHTAALAALKPEGAFLVSESSLMTPSDVRRACRAGADAALVGTAILTAENTAAFYAMLCRRTGVKLCGMMDVEGVQLCAASGAETLGFVVDYPEAVPWNIAADRARMLMSAAGRDVSKCLVTGGSVEGVIRLAEKLRPDIVQLHHREGLARTLEITAALAEYGIKTIRTIPVNEQAFLDQFGSGDVPEVLERFRQGGVSALLVDSRGADNASGKSAAAPVDAYLKIRSCTSLPVILAGGINADNAAEILRRTDARDIDIMSGIELAPGKKSPVLLARLMQQIQGGNKL